MNNFYKDIIISAAFLIGLVGFISGEFILSSALFATAALTSNLKESRKAGNAGQFSCE